MTDHKPLLTLFGEQQPTPDLAANRLAITLSQYDYEIEYGRTDKHGNADALSRLPAGPDKGFDAKEGGADLDTVCSIHKIGRQLESEDPGEVRKETAKDQLMAKVMGYTQGGWPHKESDDNTELKAFRNIKDSLYVENSMDRD